MPSRQKPSSRRRRKARAVAAGGAATRTFDARPDTLDFRDRMFQPTLVEVPSERPLERYREVGVQILDQGEEGACTGFGLATVVHYLLRTRAVYSDAQPVSPWMLYAMALRYDEWEGEDPSEGSSARGAMKGWHKHGVCSLERWPTLGKKRELDDRRAHDAVARPLGAYLRVNHRDLVALHAAIAEVGILYATSLVHRGWDAPKPDGRIVFQEGSTGAHAYAIVGYDRRGLWIQNSWGEDWGKGGFGHVGYDDWLANGMDLWVARLGAPVELERRAATAIAAGSATRVETTSADLRPHIVSLGNDGRLRTQGTYGTSEAEVADLVDRRIPEATSRWPRKRLLLYAHGGLVSEASAVQRVAEYREPLLAAGVYPLSLIWKTDYWTTLGNMLQDVMRQRRPEGALEATKDFLLDRLDDFLEPVARAATGKAQWDEMKENALRATTQAKGGALFTARRIASLIAADPGAWELHVVAHSAGSILQAPLVQLLATQGQIRSGPMKGKAGLGLEIRSCTLWAPAATVELFAETYLPLALSGRIGELTLFTLTDDAEQEDHCARIYNKSLLYLVSNAFEEKPRIPVFRPDGDPVVGMEKFLGGPGRKQEKKASAAEKQVREAIAGGKIQWVRAPNVEALGSRSASRARAHGAFDDDEATVKATLARILGAKPAAMQAVDVEFGRSRASSVDRRKVVDGLLR